MLEFHGNIHNLFFKYSRLFFNCVHIFCVHNVRYNIKCESKGKQKQFLLYKRHIINIYLNNGMGMDVHIFDSNFQS